MTPERAAELVTRWVRYYTRELPTPTAERRIDEIEADLHDHIAHERARSTSDWRIAVSVLSRMTRGLVADASWRRQVKPPKGRSMKTLPAILVAVLAVVVATVGVGAVVYGEADDSPGLQILGVLFVVGAVMMGVRTAQRSR